MTRRDRIVVLLENYQDVQPGLVDTDQALGSHGSVNGYALLARGCWNHRSYRELERLCRAMRQDERTLYWHLAETYLRAAYRRASFCPKCLREGPPSKIGELHRHGQRTVTLLPLIVRLVTPRVEGPIVETAIDWLDGCWVGEVFLPKDLAHLTPRVLPSRATR